VAMADAMSQLISRGALDTLVTNLLYVKISRRVWGFMQLLRLLSD